jgi:D-3-phosphoglycerate dehydrogenase / 2-oxoglutarate reductase
VPTFANSKKATIIHFGNVLSMRCLIVDSMHPGLESMLALVGVKADYEPTITKAEVLARIGAYQGIIVRSKLRLDATFFATATALRFVGRAGAGMDNIDTDTALAKNIAVFNAPEGNRDAVGEHTLGLLLAITNKIVSGHNQIAGGIWNREANRGTEICGKTVAILGYGNMGRAFARRLQGFNCTVLAYDKYLVQWPDNSATPCTLEQVFAQADIVSIHTPLTAETRLSVNARFLASFHKPIYLINTARGEIVSLLDLLYAIKTDRIVAAGLDVIENERFDQLLTAERVILQALAASGRVVFTPHVAGWTRESYARINEVLCQKIGRFVANNTQ